MSKLSKKTKLGLVMIVIIILVSMTIGRNFVMRKKAEEYILREARIGLKIYFEKYYNDVGTNSIKMKIKYHHHMVSGPYIEGYVNGDKDLNFKCEVIKVPKDKMDSKQDELGMVIGFSSISGELGAMQKREYSDYYSGTKEKIAPSKLIPKSEVEKVKKDRHLLNFIPEMMHY